MPFFSPPPFSPFRPPQKEASYVARTSYFKNRGSYQQRNFFFRRETSHSLAKGGRMRGKHANEGPQTKCEHMYCTVHYNSFSSCFRKPLGLLREPGSFAFLLLALPDVLAAGCGEQGGGGGGIGRGGAAVRKAKVEQLAPGTVQKITKIIFINIM